jgi:hypothetical protein
MTRGIAEESIIRRPGIKQTRQVPCSVNHTDDFDASGNRTIKDQIPPRHEITKILAQIGTSSTYQG